MRIFFTFTCFFISAFITLSAQVYDLRENIKRQIDNIADISFLKAVQTIISSKLLVPEKLKKEASNYELLIELTDQYVQIDEPELDVEVIYQERATRL